MRKLVGFAHHEGIKRVPRVELVVAALKIQFGLLDAVRHRPSSRRFFFGADVLHFQVRGSNFMENRLDDFTVSARQNLTEHGTRNLYEERVALRPVQPRGLEPVRKRVDADARFDAFKKFMPGICSFAFPASLNCTCHSQQNPSPWLYPQM